MRQGDNDLEDCWWPRGEICHHLRIQVSSMTAILESWEIVKQHGLSERQSGVVRQSCAYQRL